MDVVGGVQLVNGWKASIVSGVDDHSRLAISARVVERATARPVCDALAIAMRTFGVLREILTNNGKVFTGWFGPSTGEVLFDRMWERFRLALAEPVEPVGLVEEPTTTRGVGFAAASYPVVVWLGG